MIKAIEAVLQDMNLQTNGAPFRYCISISTGNTISVSVYADAHHLYQVKVSETPAFEGEYGAHMCAWQQYNHCVPRPIGRQVHKGWDVFVAQGVHHEPFVFNSKANGRAFGKVLGDLSQFFRISASAGKLSDANHCHELFFGVLEQHFHSSPLSLIAAHWIHQGRLLGICGLPLIAQHGDFVLNNLAYSGQQLVVFDWEDFGKYQLPGLDICSFCFSVAPSAQELQALMTSKTPLDTALGKFVHSACHASAIDIDLFKRLIPLYLLCFLYAKREYGDAVQSRIGAAISQLSVHAGV